VGVGYRDLVSDLASLLESGVPILDALEALNAEGRRGQTAELAAHLHREVSGGRTLAEALQSAAPPVTAEHAALVHAGEVSGTLPEVLREIVIDLDQRKDRTRGLLRSVYLLLVAGLALLGVLVLAFGFYGLAVAMAIGVGLARWSGRASTRVRGSSKTERVFLALPWMGHVLKEQAAARALRLLGRLLRSGMGLSEALGLTANAASTETLRVEFCCAGDRLEAKETLSSALRVLQIFRRHPALADRLTAAEKAGGLDRALEDIGGQLEAQCRLRIERFLTALPVVLTIVAGACVAGYGIWFFSRLYSFDV